MLLGVFILVYCKVIVLISCDHCDNYHRLGGLPHRNSFPHSSRSLSLKSRCHQNWFLWMALRETLFHVSVLVHGGGQPSLVSLGLWLCHSNFYHRNGQWRTILKRGPEEVRKNELKVWGKIWRTFHLNLSVSRDSCSFGSLLQFKI